LVVNYFYAIVAFYVAVVFAWFDDRDHRALSGRPVRFAAGLPALLDARRGLPDAGRRRLSAVQRDEALDYPVHVHIPERKERYSRLKTLFRVIYITRPT